MNCVMKPLVIVNAVNITLLIPLVIVYLAIGTPLWFLAIFALWLCYVIASNIYLLRSDDILVKLKRADKHGVFTNQIAIICRAVESVEFYRPIFGKYEEGNSIRNTFELLAEKTEGTVIKAIRWLSQYNKASNPSTEYMTALSRDCNYVMQKLNELNELVLQVEDSATDKDISFVDDMLSSLKEMLENEQ